MAKSAKKGKSSAAKKDPLNVKDLPVSKGRSGKVKGGAAGKCNTNTLTCKQSSVCPETARGRRW